MFVSIPNDALLDVTEILLETVLLLLRTNTFQLKLLCNFMVYLVINVSKRRGNSVFSS